MVVDHPGLRYCIKFCNIPRYKTWARTWWVLVSYMLVLTKDLIRPNRFFTTVHLLFDWFGLVCFANKNINCQLPYSWFQMSQTGGQWYSDTSPFSIPWLDTWPQDWLFKSSHFHRERKWSKKLQIEKLTEINVSVLLETIYL